jgi:peptidyl-prolyl cis-trans isomerase A (cyclophilin A)
MFGKMIRFASLLVILSLMLSACQGPSGNSSESGPEELKGLKSGLYAKITTNKGEILCFLDHVRAPMTVANFVGLAEGRIKNNFRGEGEPFFDGLTFHRVVNNFVIQGGDPMGTGAGNPGYFFRDEFHNELRHDRPGTLAMANSGRNTNGCQFYITHNPLPQLDQGYNVFGHVVKGMDVVNAIQIGDTMDKVEILRKGSAANNFDAAATFAKMRES